MPTRNNDRRKSIFASRPLSLKYAAKITFDQSKRFPPDHNLPVKEKEKKILEQAAFWHEVKFVCCLPIPFFSTPKTKLSPWVGWYAEETGHVFVNT